MSETGRKTRILFLCTGNACRSQMAEGWVRHLKSDVIEAYSGGIWPAGVSSRATNVMAEAGVDISSQTSDHVEEFLRIDFDYVITLCDNARESCPVFGGEARLVHKPFKDPVMATGSADEIMRAFRKTRDKIRAFVETLPESLPKKI
ncbi:MAG: arsenate reductase [Planctomycetes bacterium B3_Pla]|nr:MAG: arsenate reductase [Planctomycetes bacterium B3_Pla]